MTVNFAEPPRLRLLPNASDSEVAYAFDAWLAFVNDHAATILTEDEYAAMRYYDFPANLKAKMEPEHWLLTLRGFMRGEEWMLEHIRRTRPSVFCEIGCGLGTWCYLAALAGVKEVHGIDLTSRWLAPAIKLEPHFNDFLDNGSRLHIRMADIYDVEWDQPVNVFYLKSTIHHVLPLDRLFDYMWDHLAPGGVVIVHDPNALHPRSQISGFKRRGFRLRETYVDPATGKTSVMANEDFLSVPGILYRFKRRGFTIAHAEYRLGLQQRANDWWYYKVVRPLYENVWLGAWAAQTYTVVAQKPI